MKRYFLILLFFVPILICGQIQRVEPMFWWIGMKNPQLQLLVHGTALSGYNVRIDYPGVSCISIENAHSPNYKFINLQIDPKKTKAGYFNIVFQKKGAKDIVWKYELKNRTQNSAKRKGFSSSDVVYLLMPDRFANGDESNDNIDGYSDNVSRDIDYGRHGGDIKGIENHLDYISSLGATAIWTTPVLENNYPRYSYHGYAISDIYKIDPRFGTNQDYVNMVQNAHKKGLKVIMDMVSNHGGIDAWWMKDLPFPDWVHEWPQITYTNHKSWTQKDIHAAEIDKKLYIDGWFDKTMPDFNQKNNNFLTWFTQNSIWWVEYANLDGIRMDTYPYNDRDGMAKWAKAILNEYPNFNIVGETWLYSSHDIAFWQRNAVNPQQYNSYLPTVMDFILQKALVTSFNEHGQPWEEVGMNRIYTCIANDYLYADLNNLFIFAENHDTQRLIKQLEGNFQKYKMLMSVLMTMRGIPQIYYGTEIGMSGDKNKGDGDIRKDFPGGWKSDSINAFVPSNRTAEQNQYFDFTSALLKWRKTKDVIHTGKLIHYVPENDVYVYFRYNEKERMMVIVNNNLTPTILQKSRYQQMLNGYTSGTDVLTKKEFNFMDEISIPSQTALILELK